MSNRNYWDDLFLGKKVEKGSTLVVGATTKDMFTVTGGRVCITALHSEVATADIGVNASALSINVDPTVGAIGVLATGIESASAVVGTTFSITGNPADAVIKNTGVAIGCVQPCIVPAGAITYATAGTNTGSMKWAIWYYPVDDNAYVTVT